MRTPKKLVTNNSITHLAAVGLTVSAIALSSLVAEAQKTVNISIDHNQYWAAYQTVKTNGAAAATYSAGYLGQAGAPDVQGTITTSDVVRCAPDIHMDKVFGTDTAIWADATGLSAPNAGVSVDSVYYVDTGTLAKTGDTVIFSGQLLTDDLSGAYSPYMVAFIKDFDSTWFYHGEATTYMFLVSPGDTFTVQKTIVGDGSHVQYGFEWVGPPARTNPASASYVGNFGSITVSNQLVTQVAGIIGINPNPGQVRIGSNITFTAITTGTNLTYQWSKDGTVLVNGGGVSGATTNALTLTSVQGPNEGNYTLVVADPGGDRATNSVQLFVYNPDWLYYDRAFSPFYGYINVWNGTNLLSSPPLSQSQGTRPKASFGFPVAPTSILRAGMNVTNDVVTLQPNTYVYDGATNPPNPAYVNPDGSSAAYMEQDYYMQNNSLVGDTLVFAGYCSSNSLDPKYTARAWIKVSQDWSVENRYDTNLVAGQPFILTVPSSATTNKSFAQYGFSVWGPCNSSTNPITQGACEVKVYSPISATAAGANVNLSFPTVINHAYTVQYKTNATDSSWHNFSTNTGTGITITVPDAAAAQHRFYRLSTQ